MVTSAVVGDVTFGTGLQIFQNDLLPAIEAAQHEIILVTCFWADSATRQVLGDSLLKLGREAQEQQRRVRVRIGFSSTSLLQKLTQHGSRSYSPTEWHTKLGLPGELADLPALDLEITSIFYLPFSVWHPKFVIIDRRLAFLPSCNVSWEEWFEVCITFTGPIVEQFIHFWDTYWVQEYTSTDGPTEQRPLYALADAQTSECQFLPSPHCCNPSFRLPWQEAASPPQTQLNTYLLELWANARQEVYIQSPNLTSPPVLAALLDLLERGVNLEIVTSERLMILEQLITAGTTTSRCVHRFIQDYREICMRPVADEEMGMASPGSLRIAYYEPRDAVSNEPVQSHAKITIVDGGTVVFGSGNMDRASWYTSQELGVAIVSPRLVSQTKARLEEELRGRKRIIFSSGVV